MGGLSRIIFWSLRKSAFAALLALLGLVGAGLWIFLHETADFETQQSTAVRALTSEKLKLQAAMTDADRRTLATQTRISALQLRAEQAAKVAGELADLGSGLDWLTISSDQLKENNVRLGRMKEMQTDSLTRIADLRQNLVRIQWEKDGMEIAFERNQAQLKTTSEERSVLLHYARMAWTAYGTAVLIGVVLLLLLPSVVRLVRFWRS